MILGFIANVIVAVGAIAVEAAVATAAAYAVRKVLENRADSRRQSRSSPDKGSKEVINDMECVDAEIIDLERKGERDGRTSKRDVERKSELVREKERKFQELQEVKKAEALREQTGPNNFSESTLDSEHVHILQYHMGQMVLEKRCLRPGCGRPMILQTRRKYDGAHVLSDFFWGCSGFYDDSCRDTQRFRPRDVSLLHKRDVPEFQVSNSELCTIFDESSVTRATVNRVREHTREKDADILCPLHHVPMVLKEKREPRKGALDMFYLECPHYKCGQKSKLKSPAQLAAFLARKQGTGLL